RGQRRIAMQQGVDQGAIGIAGARVHHQARRLVEHQHVVVLVQDPQRDVLRHDGRLHLQARGQAHLLAAAHRLARAYLAAVEQRVPVADPGRQARARELGEQFGQHRVEPAPGGGFGYAGLAEVDGVGAGLWHGRLRFRPRNRAAGADCYYPRFVPSLPPVPMSLRPIPFRRAILLLLVIVLTTSGCGRIKGMFKDENENEGVPVEQLYDKGLSQMRNGNWAAAVVTYRRLLAQYPYGPYTEQALMETAFAYYKMGNDEEAISTIDRFLRTYPTHRNTPYMYYLRGLVNSKRDTVFLQRVWRLDISRRDLATPNQAFSDFNTLVDRYPNSRYADDARQRMAVLRNMFARHEIEVALYYMRRNALVAAVERAKYLLETYPQSEYQNDAVAVLAAAYDRLGNQTLAADARRVLEYNEPGHPYLTGDWPNYPWTIRKINPFA